MLRVVFLFVLALVGCAQGRVTEYIAEHFCDEDDPAGKFINNASQVHIGMMTAYTGRFAFLGNMFDLAFMCALETMNADPTLLPGVTLKPVFIDMQSTQAGGATAAICMHHHSVAAAVGPFSSDVSLGAATIGTIYKLNVVATSPASPLLSNKDPQTGYPYFARLTQPVPGESVAQLMKGMGFRRVATLSNTPDSYADSVIASFVSTAQQVGLEVAKVQTAASGAGSAPLAREEARRALIELRDSGSRVIFAVTAGQHAANIFAEAHDLGMIGDGWAWFTPAAGPSTDVNLRNLTEGFVTLAVYENRSTVEYAQYVTCVQDRATAATGPYANLSLSSPLPVQALTSTWDAAMVIGRAIHAIGAGNYSNAEALRDAIFDTNFKGATGRLKFDAKGDLSGSQFVVQNVRNNTELTIGMLDSGTGEVFLTEAPIYPGGQSERPVEYLKDCVVSRDFTQVVSECAPLRTITYAFANEEAERYCALPQPLQVDCAYATSGAGVGVAATALAFTLVLGVGLAVKWDTQVMKMSQRRFLAVVLVGSIILNATPLVILGPATEAKCFMLPTFITLGTVLLFGPLFVKSWRVSKLLANKKLKKMKITDATLFRMLGAMCLADVVLLVLILAFEPIQVVTTMRTVSGLEVPFEECAAESTNFATVLYFFHAALFGYGLYISYTIRHVTESLSEAKWIFIAVYNGSLCGLATLGVVQGLQTSAAQFFIIISVGIAITSTVTCALIFLPKFALIRANISVIPSQSTRTNAATSAVETVLGGAGGPKVESS